MARKYIVSISSLVILAAAPAFAADMNTYRPGQPYLKSTAGHAEMCARQCTGDAQCRGWNFIKVSPRAASGICEFNARAAMPVPSAVSISGEVRTGVDPLMSRAIPVGSRTVTVGTPVPMQNKAPQIAARPAPPSQQRQTIVNRRPVPNAQKQTRPAAYAAPRSAAQPQPKQSSRAPRVYGDAVPQAGSAPQAGPAPQQQAMRQQQPTQPPLSAEQQYYRQQYLQQQAIIKQQSELRRAQQQNTANMRGAPSAPQAMAQPMSQPIPAPASQQYQPQQQQMQQQARPQMQPPAYMPPQAMQNQQRVSNHPALTPSLNYPMQTPQPLYGSLHDDITRGSAGYRRPVTAPDDLSDPDAPIATSRAVPTKPVESQNLNRNAMPALAGG